jgi:hypothetical protein
MSVTREKCRRIAVWLSLLAMPGIVAFIFSVGCDIYLFRTNPKTPDAIHTVERVEHGTHRFFTPLQDKICSYLPFIGFAQGFSFLILASFVDNGCKFNKLNRGIFSKRG